MLCVWVSPSWLPVFKYYSSDVGTDLCLVCLFKCVIEETAKFEMLQGQSITRKEEIANWQVFNML